MLVIERKPEQGLVCYASECSQDDKPLVEVRVLRTAAGKVRLGIVADKGVRVVRSELLDAPANSANEPTPD